MSTDVFSAVTKEQYACRLANLLAAIEANDEKNGVRYRLVMLALGCALEAGYPAGVRIDPAEPEWPVAFIHLPSGQVSWHMQAYPDVWDGHDTSEKYRRCRQFIQEHG